MFNPFKKKPSPPPVASASETPAKVPQIPPPDARLRAGVGQMVEFLTANPQADDEEVATHLKKQGLSEAQATKLIQFVPIAFTRFYLRESGVQFSKYYTLLDAKGQPKSHHLVAEAPAFNEAWQFCEELVAQKRDLEIIHPIAARSGGYQSLVKLQNEGKELNGMITGPPMMWD